MATEPKQIYVDTNILAYVANTKASQHRAALEIFRPTEREILCVSSQVLAEFYSYITNPAILAKPLEPTEATFRIRRICQMPHIRLLSTPVDLFKRWMSLLEERSVTNGGIFDLLHIAIMLAHDIPTIYTFNTKDFTWCSEIEAIDPGNLIE
ncbi:type II toxin-antitoxin system VapC family toxin [Roseofilum casamattae]|uniref:Ribonuclease VapC n=1 Tax=Roseofilum casamattae BLCC-M143 TaxID=3022442 RepID=A0ABT7BT86_9CYAN|nr:PIN domain-containing protein [Roseofilum casamattae]MDJ1182400.1 PIN domain-containing protein [Roseofilum casamattae BLCC-M143]